MILLDRPLTKLLHIVQHGLWRFCAFFSSTFPLRFCLLCFFLFILSRLLDFSKALSSDIFFVLWLINSRDMLLFVAAFFVCFCQSPFQLPISPLTYSLYFLSSFSFHTLQLYFVQSEHLFLLCLRYLYYDYVFISSFSMFLLFCFVAFVGKCNELFPDDKKRWSVFASYPI